MVKLKDINTDLYLKIKAQFTKNSKTKHLKGGEVTKQKYQKIRL